MKKIFALAAAALFAGAAFADEAAAGLKTTVTVISGIESDLDDEKSYSINSDAGKNRVNVNLSYDAGDYGIETYFRSQWTPGSKVYTNEVNSDGSVDNSISMPYLRHAYGWTNLFGGNAKVSGGLLSVETWEDDFEGDSDLQGPGAQFEFTPVAVPGLNIGAAFVARNYSDDTCTVSWKKDTWTVGARYDEPDGRYTAVAGWEGGASLGSDEFVWAEFAAWETGVPGLSAGLTGYVYNPAKDDGEERSELAIAYLGYKFAAVNEKLPLTLEAFGYFNNAEEADEQTYEVEGYAAYDVNEKVTVKGSAAYWKADDVDAAWVKAGASYQPNKGASFGAYYTRGQSDYKGFGGMNMCPSKTNGHDLISLDFVFNF